MTLEEKHAKQKELRSLVKKFMYDSVHANPSRETWVPGENLDDGSLCVIVYKKRYGFLKRKKYELYLEIYENLETGFCFEDGDSKPIITVLKPKDLFDYLRLTCGRFDREIFSLSRNPSQIPDLSSFIVED